MKIKDPITPAHYGNFQKAYDFFNRELFGDSLPDVLVTLQRQARTKGYFAPDRFNARIKLTTPADELANMRTFAHELAMNPDTFTDRTDEDILSTLVHEMTHVWQQAHGTPPRRAYHDREWARKMREIGLQPTDTGLAGGKETGQSVTHFVLPGGQYAAAYARLKQTGFELSWESAPEAKEAQAKRASKTKYTCPDCGQNAWAKPESLLICGICYEDSGEAVLMLEPA